MPIWTDVFEVTVVKSWFKGTFIVCKKLQKKMIIGCNMQQ